MDHKVDGGEELRGKLSATWLRALLGEVEPSPSSLFFCLGLQTGGSFGVILIGCPSLLRDLAYHVDDFADLSGDVDNTSNYGIFTHNGDA